MLRTIAALVFAVICTASPLSVRAQQSSTTRYVYDDDGRLHAVIAPTGEAVVYEYDAAGNITSIQRLAADALALFAFSPHEGLPGDRVTFTGVGFGAGVSNVSFNGASAQIISVAPSTVVAEVPAAATTGPVIITTARGSVTTSIPFTIAGVIITPSFVALKFGETAQFTAQVSPPSLDQSVKWSVNGVEGGNSSVGTITTTGVYTAPNQAQPSVAIRATSVADALRFGEASAKVSDPNDVQSVFAASVSVSRGDNPGTAALTRQVAVQYGVAGDSQAAISMPIAVQYGNLSGPTAALSQGVSVQRGNSEQTTALANPLAVQYENTWGQFFALNAVSATNGPHLQSITPNNLTRGAATTVTIGGVGFGGATAFSFMTASGAVDSSVVASNINVNSDGTSLTVTITPGGSAALGSRIVVISTSNGDSVTVDLGTNTINVVQ
jgi:YD repeat-containing protein